MPTSRRTFIKSATLAGLPFIARAEENATGYLKLGDTGYDAGRQLFNSDLSLKPAYLAKCRSEHEVKLALGFAKAENLAVAMKSGGHCFIGSSVNDGGLTLDLSGLSQKVYLPEEKKLISGPGVKLGELYDLLLPHGRLLPAGSCAGVGLGGLTLGGGYGLFARQYGLTCDHLTRVRMVDGSGKLIDSDEDEDLLWACRGGGNGNFGVVTSMEFKTRPAPGRLGAQRFTARGLSAAGIVQRMKAWFEIAETLAEPIFSAIVLNGSQITILLTSSYPSTGRSFQKAAKAILNAGFQSKGASNSSIARALSRYYGRPGPLPFYNVSGGYYQGVEDLEHCMQTIAESVLENPGLIFQVNTLGGAIARGPDSAYSHRDSPFLGEIQAYWQKDSQREGLISGVKNLQTEIGADSHYRNYPDADLKNWEGNYYGDNYPRLQSLKEKYDPENLIRHAQSVRL